MADITRPIEPFQLTQGFGENPASYARFGLKGHNGWDLKTKYPDTPQGFRYILSSWLSRFYSQGNEGNDGFGLYFEVIVQLKNTYKLTYAHCQSIESFQVKNEAETMAISDNTGNSTASHLHLTVKKGTLSNGKFTSFDNNNGYFGAINPQIFFDELREFKKNSAVITQPIPQPIEPVITNNTKIPQIYNKEVQAIKSDYDRIPGLENDLENAREALKQVENKSLDKYDVSELLLAALRKLKPF